MRSNGLLLTAAMALVLATTACNRTGTAAENAANAAAGGSPDTAANTVTAATATAANSAPRAGPPVTVAADFVKIAAISDMYEISAAKIAEKQSRNAAVKAFAARMIHDHSATTAAVRKILASGTVNATAPADMDGKHESLIGDLNQATPNAFDKTYMDQQVQAHNEAEGVFKSYASQGDNDALKQFAKDTAPKIQSHLDMAQRIDGGLK